MEHTVRFACDSVCKILENVCVIAMHTYGLVRAFKRPHFRKHKYKRNHTPSRCRNFWAFIHLVHAQILAVFYALSRKYTFLPTMRCDAMQLSSENVLYAIS